MKDTVTQILELNSKKIALLEQWAKEMPSLKTNIDVLIEQVSEENKYLSMLAPMVGNLNKVMAALPKKQ